MASLVIAVVICGRTLYKSHQERRFEKRQREMFGELPDRKKNKKNKPQRSSRRPRLLQRDYSHAAADGGNSNTQPEVVQNAEVRRRLSDESTLAEMRMDGDWTRRTR